MNINNSKDALEYIIDPVSEIIELAYDIPINLSDAVTVKCMWKSDDSTEWKPAPIIPYIFETALKCTPRNIVHQWLSSGEVLELANCKITQTPKKCKKEYL